MGVVSLLLLKVVVLCVLTLLFVLLVVLFLLLVVVIGLKTEGQRYGCKLLEISAYPSCKRFFSNGSFFLLPVKTRWWTRA